MARKGTLRNYFEQGPNEVIKREFDWRRKLATGDTIDTVGAWVVHSPSGYSGTALTITPNGNTTTSSLYIAEGGEDGYVFEIEGSIETTNGETLTGSAFIEIKQH